MPPPNKIPAPSPEILARLRTVRHVVLDMDGTIYRGATLFPTTRPFLDRLSAMGIGFTFLTNNPTKSPADYLAHLAAMGLSVTADELVTSAQATVDWLRSTHPAARRLFVLGTESLFRQFEEAGFSLATDDEKDEPEAVVVGFDTTLSYARVCRAAWWIARKKPYVATNPDRVCPTDRKTVLVDCGAICAMLLAATGRAPDAVTGKPDPAMIGGLLARRGLDPTDVAVVGDRLYTDVAMAHRAGALGILVLTGEATADEAERAVPPPHLVVPGLAELGAILEAARRR